MAINTLNRVKYIFHEKILKKKTNQKPNIIFIGDCLNQNPIKQ